MSNDRYTRMPDPAFRRWVQTTISVIQVGLGSIGRRFAIAATQLGISRATTIDPDKVAVSDFRSGYGTAEVGLDKVEACGQALTQLNPDITYHGHKYEVCDHNRERLSQTAAGANVGALIFDDFPDNFRTASDIVYTKPAIAVFLTEGVGEIAWSIPGQTPCLADTLDVERKTQIKGGIAPAHQLQITALVAVSVLEELLYLSYPQNQLEPKYVVLGRNLIYVSFGRDQVVIDGPRDLVLQTRTVGIYGAPEMRNPSCNVCDSYLQRRKEKL